MISQNSIPVGPNSDIDPTLVGPYWEAASEGRLVVPACPSCSNEEWPPRPMCRRCGNESPYLWREVSGRGVLFTWTVVHHTGLPSFKASTPFPVGVVQLDDAPVRMLGRLAGFETDGLQIGQRLRTRFVEVDGGMRLPMWTPADRGLS